MHSFDKRERGFHILSLDGGGIRGAYTAALLASWERHLQRPIGDFFDLIAGTSTGGIIALALSIGIPASKIEEFYTESGPLIFRRQPPRATAKFIRAFFSPFQVSALFRHVDIDAFLQTRYTAETLKLTLEHVLHDSVLEDARCRLVIPAVDLIKGKPTVFTTPHMPQDLTRRTKLVDIALATSAAPTYFPHHSFSLGNAFCDGGLWANNPAIVAYCEAVRIAARGTQVEGWRFESANEIHMLSIGTGEKHVYVNPEPDRNPGIIWWGPRLFDVSAETQSEGIHKLAAHLMGPKYERINFQLPDPTWKLDNTAVLPELVSLGRAAAAERFPNLADTFFGAIATPFVPVS